MRGVLFVDDEPRVLEGLENLLWRQRRKWRLVYAPGAEAALRELAAQRFDVVISDMRMPGMDGAALLGHVQRLQPHTIRVILSGYTELQAALQALPVAHQFLTKPASAQVIEQVVERGCHLQALIQDEQLRRLVGQVPTLPCARPHLERLRELLAPEKPVLAEVIAVLRRDVAMCSKVLQLASSTTFGGGEEPPTLPVALGRLGSGMLRQLAASEEVFSPWAGGEPYAGLLAACTPHSRLAAILACRMLEDRGLPGAAGLVAGMLHDIGKLVLALQLPERYATVRAAAEEARRPLYEVETEVLGASHAEVGGYLLGMWGLPTAVVEAVANHHFPMRVPHTEFGALAAVHAADALVHEVTPQGGGEAWRPLFPAYLASLGVSPLVPRWRAAAEEALLAMPAAA